LTSCRAFDTRVGAVPLAAGEVRRFVAPGTCGIPAGASAVSANVTVTGSSAVGTLVVYPGDLAVPPNAETLRFRAGQTRANNTIYGLASDGSGSFLVQNRSASAAHVILDVNGYFE
jgi:hypothetical protein